MADDLIPEDVRQFIIENIDSVAELEGLLLLRKNSQTEWSVEALAQGLYTNRQQSQQVLEHLHSLGFLAVNVGEAPNYIYQPNSPELARMVDRVDDIYAKYLIPVTNLIHNKPQTKVQQFADAFKFRKKEDK